MDVPASTMDVPASTMDVPAALVNWRSHVDALNCLLDRICETAGQPERDADVASCLRAVGALCPLVVGKALDLADRAAVTLIEAHGGRRVARVAGSEPGVFYLVLPGYCSCHYFQETVLRFDQDFQCKHSLAAGLVAALMGLDSASSSASTLKVSDAELAAVLDAATAAVSSC
eukprot:Selendium_serpulae@DN3108_c0_g1_i1.p1